MLKTKQNAQSQQKKTAVVHHGSTVHTPHGVTTTTALKLHDQAAFTWQAQEYLQYPKGSLWYLIEAIIIAVILVQAYLSANYTLIFAALAFVGVYHYLQHRHPPKQIKITVSRMGIHVDKMFFPYSHINAFWLIYHPPYVKTLNLSIHKRIYSDVVIQLGDQDPNSLREYLCSQIPELEGKNERFADTILRLLRF